MHTIEPEEYLIQQVTLIIIIFTILFIGFCDEELKLEFFSSHFIVNHFRHPRKKSAFSLSLHTLMDNLLIIVNGFINGLRKLLLILEFQELC